MAVGLLTIELFLHDTTSLKEKRSCLMPIVRRLRSKFNVSVCEAEAQGALSRGVIEVACVGTNDSHVQSQLQAVVNQVMAMRLEAEVVDTHMELIA